MKEGTPTMADLTTLANVKEYIDIASEDTTFDSLIERLIGAASAQIESYCGREFHIQDYSETRDGNASDIMFPEHTPIVSVASLAIDDEEIDAADFKVYDHYIRLVERLFTAGALNVAIEYSAGYFDAATESPPADLEDACVQLVAFKFNLRTADGLRQTRVNEITYSYADLAIPLSVAVILDRYRRPKIGAV
jgi:uncharacterized phiE125 gp8 family phage protein